jgi:hypothetical protein
MNDLEEIAPSVYCTLSDGIEYIPFNVRTCNPLAYLSLSAFFKNILHGSKNLNRTTSAVAITSLAATFVLVLAFSKNPDRIKQKTAIVNRIF